MNVLGGLSPFGPIFGKELRVSARRRRNYFLRVAYLGGLLMVLLLAWSITHTFNFGSGSVAQRAQQQQQLGYFFFAFFSMFCIGAMALIGPVLTSTAINGEQQAKTFHVLLMTPLTAWQIVSGKLFSRLLTAVTLLGLSLPVLALVRLLGGVELDQMFGVISLCAVTAMFSAAVGLLLSILLRRAFAVIILAYLSFAVLYFFAPLLVAALLPRSMGRLPWWSILSAYNPFFSTGLLGWGQMRWVAVHWHICALIHIGATALLLVISANLVRRLAKREGESAPATQAGPAADALPAIPAAPGELPLPRISSRPGRTVSDRPVLWRELRRPLMTKRWQRIAGSLVLGGLLFLAYIAAGVNGELDDKGFQAFLLCCFYTLLLLITCVISATSIAQEKEGETWTILLASPLSGSAIVWGKALGVARRLMWPMALVVAHLLVFTVSGVIEPTEMIIGVAGCAMFNTIWLASGVCLSLKFRKVTTAVIVNMALPVLLYAVGSLIILVFDVLIDAHGDLVEQVTWYLPYYYLGEGLGGGWNSGSTRNLPGSSEQISLEAFTILAVFVGLVYVMIATAILAWTARRFNATVARAPQREPLEAAPGSRSVSWAAAGS